MSMQRLVWTLGIGVAVLAVSACASGDDASETPAATPDVVQEDTAAPDIGGTPEVEPEPEFACNHLLQDCVAGENCTFLGQDDDAAQCTPSGSKAYGEPCGGTQECLFGM